jgi:small subunit ribosomal protein S15
VLVDKEQKQQIIEQFKISEKDTGSVEVQIALITARINHLTEHLKVHPKDFHSRRGLMKMVGRRRKMLRYLKRANPESYRNLIEKLNLRK